MRASMPDMNTETITDREFMLHAFKGNQAAVDYVLMVARVVEGQARRAY